MILIVEYKRPTPKPELPKKPMTKIDLEYMVALGHHVKNAGIQIKPGQTVKDFIARPNRKARRAAKAELRRRK